MDNLRKYKVHLLIISILALAQFLWLPAWEQKQQSFERLEAISGNIIRVESLIQNEEQIISQANHMQQAFDLVEEQLQQASNIIQYRLQQQRRVENVLSDSALAASSLAWRQGPHIDGMQRLFLDLQVTGSLTSYFEFLDALSTAELSHLEVARQSVRVRGQSQGTPGTVTGQLTLQVLVGVTVDEAGE